MTSRAFEAGLADGLAWDLGGFETWDDVEGEREGWDEATINAMGGDWCRRTWGIPFGDGEAWQRAMVDYNRGAYAGATIREGRSGAPPRLSRVTK